MAKPIVYPPEFEASYQEIFHTLDGVSITKSEREKAKELALFDWNLAQRQAAAEIPEDPIADQNDTPGEALEKIVSASLKSMTPSDAIKHRSQLLKFAGDTVLIDRKAKIEKQSLASGLSIIAELFRQVAIGELKPGPGWIDATALPTLSVKEQAEAGVNAEEDLETFPAPITTQRAAI